MRIYESICLLLIAFTPLNTSAQILTFTSQLDSAQHVPDTGSAGTGTASFTLDTATLFFTYNIVISNLSSSLLFTDIHGPALPGVNANSKFSLTGSSPIIGSRTLNQNQANELINDLWYVVPHTTGFGNGEIRGQLINTTIPAAPVNAPLTGIAASLSILLGLVLTGIYRIKNRS